MFMPLRIVHGATTDLDRFLHLGLPSITRFIPLELIHEFIVVTPSRDKAAVARALRTRGGIRFRVVDEDEHLPPGRYEHGWFKQQVIKLNASIMVETDWMLVLDADVVACRPVTVDELFPDGKAVVHREPAGTHREWWRGSAKLLGVESPFTDSDFVMGVTPELIHVPTLKNLALTLSALTGGEPWQSFLLRKEVTDLSWTEYSLYWTYITINGMVSELYSGQQFSMYGSSIWERDDRTKLSDAEFWEEIACSKQLFLVVQSRIGLNISEILPKLSVYANGRATARFEIELLKARELVAGMLGRLRR